MYVYYVPNTIKIEIYVYTIKRNFQLVILSMPGAFANVSNRRVPLGISRTNKKRTGKNVNNKRDGGHLINKYFLIELIFFWGEGASATSAPPEYTLGTTSISYGRPAQWCYAEHDGLASSGDRRDSAVQNERAKRGPAGGTTTMGGGGGLR